MVRKKQNEYELEWTAARGDETCDWRGISRCCLVLLLSSFYCSPFLGAYVNLDLVELDEVPGMEDDDDESRRQLSAIDINPHVRQALSAIVEAIAEVSSMKVDDEPQGMELDAHAHAAQQAAAHAQIAAQQQAHAQVLQQAAQLGMHPATFIQMQQQMQASQQAAMLQQQRALQMHAAQQQQIQQQQHP